MTQKPNIQDRIAVVCRDQANLANVAASLALDHDVLISTDGVSALGEILIGMPTLVLVDVDVPGIGASEFLRRLHRSCGEHRPIIVLFGPRTDIRLRAIATHGLVDTIVATPCSDGAFLERLWKSADARTEAEWVRLNPVQRSVLKLGLKSVQAMEHCATSDEPIDQTIVNDLCGSMVAAARSDQLAGVLESLKAHHNQTFVHVLKVASTMTLFTCKLGIREADLRIVAQAGMLHDIGKLAVSADILHKPGPLDADEWRVMQGHPDSSLQILARSGNLPRETIDVARNHHERLDGTGYPRGLKGGAIDDLSLVCAICDVYVSLTEKRAYKARLSIEDSLVIMKEMTAGHIEPSYFEYFRQMVGAGVLR